MPEHFPPTFGKREFHCPLCGVYAAQHFADVVATPKSGQNWVVSELHVSRCSRCRNDAIWHNRKLIFPDSGSAAMPHDEMPDDVKLDFEEASSIAGKSPRGAAALLRLALQKLMVDLGEAGKDLNKDIGSLVAKGLPDQIRKACDTLRVIGNEQVHPGVMDLRDTPEIAYLLFDLVNMVVETQIAQPKRLDALYGSLPPSKLKGIEERDKKPGP